jgi:transcriptional regulator GlxA family with amidase domain
METRRRTLHGIRQDCIMHTATETSASTGRARVPPPQIVKRLDAFLHAHLDEPIHMAQLCDATGVSERSLRNACHAVCGTSPKRYLTRRRLEAVHTALANARPGGATVTRIATDYGFFELGRFAAIYTSFFGERPSETLRATVSRQSAA